MTADQPAMPPTETAVAGGELAMVVLGALGGQHAVANAHEPAQAKFATLRRRFNDLRLVKVYEHAIAELSTALAKIAHGRSPIADEPLEANVTLPLLLQRATMKATLDVLTAVLDGTPEAEQATAVDELLATSDPRFHIGITATVTRDMVRLVGRLAVSYSLADDIADYVRARSEELDMAITDAEVDEWLRTVTDPHDPNPTNEGDQPS